jgi:hypothetical protein
MGIQKARHYCPQEKKAVIAERQTPNHVLHLLLSVITCGLWLPVWLLLGLFGNGPWLCPSCAARTRGWVTKDEKRLLKQQ